MSEEKFRSKELLEACRELPCQMCGISDGTIVAAHSNQLRDGKGMGTKAPDYAIAALCHDCHMMIDQGQHMSKEEKAAAWDRAHILTLRLMIMRGILRINLRRATCTNL